MYKSLNEFIDVALVSSVRFPCTSCKSIIDELVKVPWPDFENIQNYVSLFDEMECTECGHINKIIVENNYYSCRLQVDGTESDGEEIYISPPCDNDIEWLKDNSDQFDVLKEQLKGALFLIADAYNPQSNALKHSKEAQETYNIMIHGYLVAALEGYLGGKFKNLVLNNFELKRKFCEVKKVSMGLSINPIKYLSDDSGMRQVMDEYRAKVENDPGGKIETEIGNISFHNVENMISLFKEVLNVDVPDCRHWLIQAVEIRHDCAHRAGVKKDGARRIISQKDLYELHENIRRIGRQIEDLLNQY